MASRLGRKVSLDLFSPGLASVVGQDYRALSRYSVWAKPMTYRVAMGPAGLRLEIPALVEGVAAMFDLSEVQYCRLGVGRMCRASIPTRCGSPASSRFLSPS